MHLKISFTFISISLVLFSSLEQYKNSLLIKFSNFLFLKFSDRSDYSTYHRKLDTLGTVSMFDAGGVVKGNYLFKAKFVYQTIWP